jgi:hypothetical protein
MMNVNSKQSAGDNVAEHGIWRRITGAIAVLAVTLACVPAHAAEMELLTKLPGKSRLVNLEIEIWPEFDRPAALVLLKGELANAGQSISLRLPVSSGGPAAVAQSIAAGGNLLNLPYERIDGKEFITLRITPPERFFHIEFYDKLDTGKEKRDYRYQWPGDIAADHVSVHVQQPAAVTNFAITPAFTDGAPGGDTLTYWTKDMGAVPVGKTLPIAIRYTKTDARTSKEILGPSASASAAAPAADAPLTSASPVAYSFDARSEWISAAIFVLIGVAGGVLLWHRRSKPSKPAAAAGFCTKCGNTLRTDDRFCSKCGASVTV